MHSETPSETDPAPTSEFVLAFRATLSDLVETFRIVDQYAARRNLDATLLARLRLIIEELVTNTIKYGHLGDDDGGPVRLELSAGPPLTMVYEDSAAPFDPIAWYDNWRAAPPDPEVEGQRGIAMILGLASTARYQALPQGNRLILTLP